MKKIMIAAAIVCAAAMSQAAQISWASLCMCDGEGSTLMESEAAGTVNGWVFTHLSAADYALLTDSASIWAGFDAANNQLTINGTTYNAALIGSTTEGYIEFGSEDGYGKGEQLYAALVFTTNADGKDLYSANTVEGIVGQSGLDATMAGVAWGEISEGMGGGELTTWQSVPEPTSGLLLLLGVAGLALRRRRA